MSALADMVSWTADEDRGAPLNRTEHARDYALADLRVELDQRPCGERSSRGRFAGSGHVPRISVDRADVRPHDPLYYFGLDPLRRPISAPPGTILRRSWLIDTQHRNPTEPVVTVEQLIRDLDAVGRPEPRPTGRESTTAARGPIFVGHATDGVPILRARPSAPAPDEPDMRVCDGCGESLAGKRPQAVYCAACLPTVQNTNTKRRKRANDRRGDADGAGKLAAEFVDYANNPRKHPVTPARPLDPAEIADLLGRFGPVRARGILDAVHKGMSADSVEEDDVTNRNHRTDNVHAHTLLYGEADGEDVPLVTLSHLVGPDAELAAGTAGEMSENPDARRKTLRWPKGPDLGSKGRSAGALVRIPPYPRKRTRKRPGPTPRLSTPVGHDRARQMVGPRPNLPTESA